MARGQTALVLLALAPLAAAALACGDDGATGGERQSGPVCAGDPSLTYADFGKSFLATYCAPCHGGSVTGDARNGAPSTHVFDTQAQVIALRDEIIEQAVVLRTMPFAGARKPSDEERERLGEWLACGAP